MIRSRGAVSLDVGAISMWSIFRRLTAHAAIIVTACMVCAAVPHGTRGDDAAGMSREELVRKWDLNSDGSIDEGEAEVARSRMRRDRAELQLKSGIDPLTGKPRILAVDDADPRRTRIPSSRSRSGCGRSGPPGKRACRERGCPTPSRRSPPHGSRPLRPTAAPAARPVPTPVLAGRDPI